MSTISSNDTQTGLRSFEDDLQAAIATLRETFLGLNRAIGADALRPQDVSRRLRLNKNLTWKVMRIIQSEEPADAISMLPGAGGVEIYLRAFQDAGAPAECATAVRQALARLEYVTTAHIGDREQLDTVLDGLRREGNLEHARRLAFRGLSGVFGTQARLRITSQIIAPSASRDPSGSYDYFLAIGLIGLQRLRSVEGLPLFRFVTKYTQSAGESELQMLPLLESTSVDPRRKWLLENFSTADEHALRTRSSSAAGILELGTGPIGSTGINDFLFGGRMPNAIPVRRSPGDFNTDFSTAISVPSESVVTDLFVPLACKDARAATAQVVGTLAGPLSNDPGLRTAAKLPITARIESLLMDDASLAIQSFPRYPELVRTMFDAAKLNPAEFLCLRVRLEYPPCPAVILVGWEMSE